MTVQYTKKEKKEIAKLRAKIHAYGPISTIKDMFIRSEEFGDRIAVVEKIKRKDVCYTVKEFHDRVRYVGTALYEMGLGGKHIGIVSENSYNYIVMYFAIVCGGGVAVPIDKELSDKDISMLVSKGDAVALCHSKNYKETAKLHLENDDRCQFAFNMTPGAKAEGGKFLTVDYLAEMGKELVEKGDRRFIDAEVTGDMLASIVFTSGTTGTNKGVMLTHFNFASNVDGLLEFLGPEQSTMSILPMNHVYELSCSVLTAIYMYGVIYVNDSLKNILPNINDFKPTAMAVVPLVLEAIYNGIRAKAEASGKLDIMLKMIKISNKLLKVGIDIRPVVFKQIKENFGGQFPTMSCGGAPARGDHIKFLSELGFKIISGYGMTECSPTITLHSNGKEKPLSAGKAFPRAQFRIDSPDEDGIGEIQVKGDNVTKGYYKDEEATKASFTEDGWFKTGDYGRLDEDGDLYITGRKKFLIILPNGENIFPETVESNIMEYLPYAVETVAFEEKIVTATGKEAVVMSAAIYVNKEFLKDMSDEEIIAKTKLDVSDSNKGQPSYRKVQNVYVSFKEFEKNSTRKVIRQKVIDTYTKTVAK
ncbi:MAG: AMP-binding protein [Clostridia bacterium]|nr:AMP-binding protein [Clostridia bacterium]